MSRNEGLLDVGEIKRAIDILKPNGELYEIRMVKGKDIYSGYFKDTDTMIAALGQVDLRGLNTYFTLNTIDNACYARAQKDKFIKMWGDGDTTKDKHITRYKWLLIDLDPERVSGVSSTNDELNEAKELAPRVKNYLSGIGFREPIWAISGNGIHLLYRIDLEANDKSKDLMEAALKSLDILFSNDTIKLDTTVFNPSRICKLYGTMAQKGASTDERPHRMSRIVKVPEPVQITSRKSIETLAAVYKDLNPPTPKNSKPSSYTSKEFDIEEWLNRHGLRYTIKEAKDYTKYVLDECPFDSSHKAPDAMITKGNSGEIGFKCLHDHCSCYKWRDVRIKYEPEAYEQKSKSESRINKGWEQHKGLKANLPEKPPDEETTAADNADKLEPFHRHTEKGKAFETFDIRIVNDIVQKCRVFIMNEKPYIYEGGYYRCDDKGKRIKALISKYIYEHLITATRIDRIYKLFLQHVEIQKKYETINRYPKYWINFQNGMLDLKTMELLPHKPEYFSINQIPHKWEKITVADNSTVVKYLKSFIPNDDDRQMFLEYAGYSLTIDTHFQKMLYIKGVPNIGKSVLLNLMEAVVGIENKVNLKVQNLNDRFSPAFLLGKIVNIYADVPSTEMPDISGIKTITGEDTVRGEYKGGDVFFFRPYCKLLFSANTIPYANDDKTNAYYRRLLILQLEKRADYINNINEALLADIGTFIALITAAAHNLYIRGEICESNNSKDAVKRLYMESDTVMAFLYDMTENTPEGRIKRNELYQEYDAYCGDHNRQSKAETGFYASLRDKGYNERKSSGIWYFTGLRLNDGKNGESTDFEQTDIEW